MREEIFFLWMEKKKLYVIKGITYDNLVVYTKGKISNENFYILISSKRAL